MGWFVSGKKTEAVLHEYPEIKVKERLKKVEISGCSRMFDPAEYYEDLTKKLRHYFFSFNRTLMLDIHLEFISTTSTKLILLMLKNLQKLAKKDGLIEVNWYYEEDDETIQETGEIFDDSLDIPFHMIVIEVE